MTNRKLKPIRGFSFKNKNALVFIGITFIVLVIACFVFFTSVKPASEKLISVYSTNRLSDVKVPSALLKTGDILAQALQAEDTLKGVGFAAGSYNETFEIGIECRVYDAISRQLLDEVTIWEAAFKDNSSIYFPVRVQGSSKGYWIEFKFLHIPEGKQLSAWMVETTEVASYLNGVALDAAVSLDAYVESDFLVPYYWAMALLLTLFSPILWYITFVKKLKIEQLFVAVAVVLGLLHMFVFMPQGTPDEARHINMALFHSNFFVGGEKTIDKNNKLVVFEMREEDRRREEFPGHNSTKDGYRLVFNELFEREKSSETLIETSMYLSPWYQYIPQTLGISLARLLTLGQVGTLYLGRLFSLLFYVVAMYWIIKIAPFKTVFALAGLLPQTLSLAGSFSYDTTITLLAFLFLAQVFRLAFTGEKISLASWIGLLVNFALLAPLKIVYFAFGLMIFVVPKEKWTTPKHRIGFIAVFFVAGIAAILLFSSQLITNSVDTLQNDVNIFGEQDSYSYKMIFHDTAELLRLLSSTFIDTAGKLISAGGDILQKSMPWSLNIVMMALLVGGAIGVINEKSNDVITISGRQKRWIAGIAVMTYALIIAVAIPWTLLGAFYIDGDGPQSRYYIPMIPMLPLLFKGALTKRKNNDRQLLFAMYIVGAYAVLYIFLRTIF